MNRARVPVAIALSGSMAMAGASCSGSPDGATADTPSEVTLSSTVLSAPTPDVPRLAWGPTVVDMAEARAAAAALPLDVAAGQVIVAAWSSPDAEGAASLVADQHLAGLILMRGAIVDAAQVAALTAAVSEAGRADGRTWPAVVSTDQEGGPVARLEGIVPDLPAFMAAGSATDLDSVTRAYTAQARDLASLGFTVDWAPDADVTIGAGDTTIGVRSAGTDPARVADTVGAAVEGFMAGGVVPAIKHFPGHGSVTADSHTGLPVQGASVEQLADRDFIPFRHAIEAGAPMVMLGHLEVPAWGAEPATVSAPAYAYLREDLGFTGVAVTDALNMAAVADRYGPGEAGVAALAAGADLLLMPQDPAVTRQAIVDAVTSGGLPRERLDEAVARVSLLMTWQAGLVDGASAAPDPSYARQAAAEWATVSSPACGGRLVGDSVTISGGWPAERQILADALAEHGVGTGGGTSVRLIGSASGGGAADVVVAMDAPWGLPGSQATTYVGLYGRSDDALRGLADVLVGAATPGGDWAMPGMPTSCAAASP